MCQKAAQEWRIIMGILTRFKDIMSANINALLDKCEDPEKMIDQYMRNLESDLGKVKAETASVMAEETRCKRELDECTADVAKYQSYAEKALKAGNEADARTFLEKKQQLVSKQATLQQTYNIAADNAAKMRQMHDKLLKQEEMQLRLRLQQLRLRRESTRLVQVLTVLEQAWMHSVRWRLRLIRCLIRLMQWQSLTRHSLRQMLTVLQLSMMQSQLTQQLMMN